jgi:CIC family chloride channel protein
MPLYVLLAFILAPVAFFTVRTMAFQHLVWERFARLPAPLRTALAGAALGVVGLMLPQVLGDGREPMRAVFDGEVRFGALFLVTLGIAKILATGFSQAGGFVGGTFTPLVATGIFIGAGFGQLFQSFGLGALSDPQVFAIVGMAGMLSGVIRAPVTAALLAFEMTQDAALVMPILLTVIICLLVTRRLTPLGLYATELLSRGSNVHQLRYINLVRSLTEDSELGVSRRTIDATASVDELRAVLDEEPTDAILVVDATGHLSGLVTSADLARGLAENPGEQLTVADLYAKFETR